MSADDAKQAWQASIEIAGAPPLEEVRAGADKFYRFVRRRNRIEYGASAIVIIAFTAYALFLSAPTARIGAMLVVLGTFFALWQLHRRASAVAPETAGTMPILSFARLQLVRQRDALRSIFWWYILPFLPGLLVFLIGPAIEQAIAGGSTWATWAGLAGALTVLGAVFAGIWKLNYVVARKLQVAIDEIDALTGEEE